MVENQGHHFAGGGAVEIAGRLVGVACHDDLATEREIVADENPCPGTERDGQTLVDAVADADREIDAVRNRSNEVENPKKPSVRARECELVSVNLEAGF